MVYKTQDWSLEKEVRLCSEIRAKNALLKPAFISETICYLPGKQNLTELRLKDKWEVTVLPDVEMNSQIAAVLLIEGLKLILVSKEGKITIWDGTNEKANKKELDIMTRKDIIQVEYCKERDELFLLSEEGELEIISNISQEQTQKQKDISQAEEETEFELNNENGAKTAAQFAENQKKQKGSESEFLVENEKKDSIKNLEKEKNLEKIKSSVSSKEKATVDKEPTPSTNLNAPPTQPSKKSKRTSQYIIDEEEERLLQEFQNNSPSLSPKKRRSAALLNSNQQKSSSRAYPSEKLQPAFQPSQTNHPGNRNYLVWNLWGKVISRKTTDIDFVDVEYALDSISKKVILNSCGYSLASLSYLGVALATPGYFQDENEYEDELLEEGEKRAKLFFESATEGFNWNEDLPIGENILSVATGSTFIAIATSKSYLRLYTPRGQEFFIIGLEAPIVTIAAYENLVAVVYHRALPFGDRQQLSLRVINTMTLKVVKELPVCLSPGTFLEWIGFSKEGAIFSQDSSNTVWALFDDRSWAPVLSGADMPRQWLVGFNSGSMYSVPLAYGESQPNPLTRPNLRAVKLKMPFAHAEGNELAMKMINLDQDKQRRNLFGHMAGCEISKFDNMDYVRNGILNDVQIRQQTLDLDKMKLDYCRRSLLNQKPEDAIWYGLLIESHHIFNVCVNLIQQMGQPELAQRLKIQYYKLGVGSYRRQSVTQVMAIQEPRQVILLLFRCRLTLNVK